MKTAMQILKEEIQSKVFQRTNLTDYQYGHNVAYGVVLTFIEYLLEKEKEQIIKAHNQKQYIIDIMKADEDDGLYNQNK
jgi:hypothetical protein